MKGIKQVIRYGVVETNSSSTHSVSISMRGPLTQLTKNKLNIKNGTLFIPERCKGEFGQDFFKTNDCLEKLYYVCGLMCNDIETVSGQKRIHRLKSLLKSFLGVNDVVFEWDQKYYKSIKEGINPEDIWRNYPEVDHQSRELIDEIYENKSTLLNFIFNPNSWLYGGSDNVDHVPQKFYQETKINMGDSVETSYAIVSIYFPKPIGRLDILIDQPDDVPECMRNNQILQALTWNPKTDSMETVRKDIDSFYYPFFNKIIMDKDSKTYIMFIHDTDNWIKLRSYINGNSWDKTSRIITNPEYFNLLEEGIDYKLFPLDLKLIEFEYDDAI